jgi:hypothetical protein
MHTVPSFHQILAVKTTNNNSPLLVLILCLVRTAFSPAAICIRYKWNWTEVTIFERTTVRCLLRSRVQIVQLIWTGVNTKGGNTPEFGLKSLQTNLV